MKNLLLTAAFCALGTAASAVTQDFEGFNGGDDITGQDLGGFTLTAGGDIVEIVNAYDYFGTGYFIGSNPFVNDNPYRADFSVLGVNQVSVGVGDANADADDLFLFAYDMFDTLIDSYTTSIANSFVGFETLTVSGPNIAYVVFGGGNQVFPNSVYADNFTYSTAAVPLPAGGLLLLGALGLLGFGRRRRA